MPVVHMTSQQEWETALNGPYWYQIGLAVFTVNLSLNHHQLWCVFLRLTGAPEPCVALLLSLKGFDCVDIVARSSGRGFLFDFVQNNSPCYGNLDNTLRDKL